MDLAQLRQVVRNELSCNPSGLIDTMGEKSKSTMTDIPAVMDELTLLNSVVNDLETKQIAHPEAAPKHEKWICILPHELGADKIICSLPIPPHQLSMHSFWLTEKVPKVIQERPTQMIMMYEYKNSVLFPEWFILLFWGEQDDFCLPILTHYSMLEQELGEWNETALHRSATYGLKLDDLIHKFGQVTAELNEQLQIK